MASIPSPAKNFKSRRPEHPHGDFHHEFPHSLLGRGDLDHIRRWFHIPTVEILLPGHRDTAETIKKCFLFVHDIFLAKWGLSFPIPRLLLAYMA